MKFIRYAVLAAYSAVLCQGTAQCAVGLGTVAIVAAGAASTLYAVPKLFSVYHNNAVANARKRISSQVNLNEKLSFTNGQPLSNPDKDAILLQLSQRKEEIRNMWKNQWSRGLTLSGTISYSGRVTIARAVAFFDMNVVGSGLLDQCIVGSEAILDGDFVLTSCHFKGKLSVTKQSTVVSCNNCLIGELEVESPSGSTVPIIECINTIIEGDIMSTNPCIVVLDQNSLIGGRIVNATVIYRNTNPLSSSEAASN